MTKNEATVRSAMKLALKRAFQYGADYWYQADHDSYKENKKADKTLEEFRRFVDETCEALAENPAQQEPVATISITQHGSCRTIDNHFADCVRDWPDGEYQLYTTPQAQPAREPLTDEQIAEIAAQGHQRWIEFARAIEAAHQIGVEK